MSVHEFTFLAVLQTLLLFPDASLDAQSVDSRLSCEACLCHAEYVRKVSCVLDASSELSAAGHES